MGLEFGHSILQLQPKTGRARRVVFGDVPGDLVTRQKRCFRPSDQHRSDAVFVEHRFDLLVGGEFTCISL
jgi:hypothetical protein